MFELEIFCGLLCQPTLFPQLMTEFLLNPGEVQKQRKRRRLIVGSCKAVNIHFTPEVLRACGLERFFLSLFLQPSYVLQSIPIIFGNIYQES